ncbi:MAG: molybdenum cofactor guanylyltransferase [Phycisphaerales bacterium]|nr:molybdenum cofactor guanylyltransferase [Phycisphaerales bacterium]
MISLEPPKPWPHAAVILSGGGSRRMGVPKGGMLLPDGRNMLERTRDMLASFCGQVVISGNPHGAVGHEVIQDLRPDSGPLAAIEATLSSGISPQYLLVPCDLPLLPAGLLARLLVGENDGMACFETPAEQGLETRSLPCRIGTTCLPQVIEMLDSGDRAVRGLVERLGPMATRVSLASREVDLLMNVNTPDDYERACQLLRIGAD